MRRAAQLITALSAMALLGGCASAHAARVGSRTSRVVAGGTCGQSYSAGHVPVILKVSAGSVPCPQAQQVELAYNHDILTGAAKGNGGGGAVKVGGWTCNGLPTPRILQTGEVSTCTGDGGKFDAVLASASPGPSHN
jgi:hypothetical protein